MDDQLLKKIVCPNCGNSFHINDYCNNCGKKIENIKTCNKCNKAYLNNLNGCPYCFSPSNTLTTSKLTSNLLYFQSTFSIIFLLSSYFILQQIVGLMFYSFIPDLNQLETSIFTFVNLLVTIVSNIGFLFLLKKFSIPRKTIERKAQSTSMKALIIFGGFIISISFLELSLTVLNYLCNQLSIPPTYSSPYDEFFENSIVTAIFFFLVVIIGPLFEEIVFRQYVCSFLEFTINSKRLIIIVSGVFFSLNHLAADSINGSLRYTIEHLYVIFVLGLVLGIIYYKYGLKFSVIFHSLWNSFTFFTQFQNFLPDLDLLSNLFIIIGIVLLVFFGGLLIVKNLYKLKSISDSIIEQLTKMKFSLRICLNISMIIVFIIVISLFLIESQEMINLLLLFALHTLGTIFGFLTLNLSLLPQSIDMQKKYSK